MKRYWLLLVSLLAVLTLALAGCGGGGGGNPDRDGDGIPNVEDAFPDDPARFAAFTRLDLPPLTGTFASAAAINDSNLIVGTASEANGDVHPVLWNVSGTTPTATLVGKLEIGSTFGAAFGINNAGDAVGEAANATGRDAIFWAGPTPTGASQVILSPIAGAPFSAAYGINNSKRIVGESQSGAVTKAVTWLVTAGVPGQPSLLGEPAGATASSAYFIDDNNRIVGEYTTAPNGPVNGILWMPNPDGTFSMVPLPPLPNDVESVAYGINDDGRIVGESTSAAGDVRGVTWTVAGTVATPAALGTAGEGNALAVNDSGRMAGWTMATGATDALATLWDQRNLGLADSRVLDPAATFSMGFGMNNAGSIVGMADNMAFVAVSR